MWLHKAEALLTTHRDKEDTLMVVTSTNRFIVAPICKKLGIKHLIATELEESDNKCTGQVSGIPSVQKGKVKRLNNWLKTSNHSLEGSSFYSDSINDLSQINLDTEYARTKYDAELLLKSILPAACILRIGGVFGHHGPSHLGINRSIAEAISGVAPVMYGDGANLRNYIYVDDLSQTISDIIKKGICGTHLVAGQEVQSV